MLVYQRVHSIKKETRVFPAWLVISLARVEHGFCDCLAALAEVGSNSTTAPIIEETFGLQMGFSYNGGTPSSLDGFCGFC